MTEIKYPGLPSEYYLRRKAAFVCGFVALFGPIASFILLIFVGALAQVWGSLLVMFLYLSPMLILVSVGFALAAGSVRRAHERQNP